MSVRRSGWVTGSPCSAPGPERSSRCGRWTSRDRARWTRPRSRPPRARSPIGCARRSEDMATEPVEQVALVELEEGLDALQVARPVSDHPAIRVARSLGPRLGAVVAVILIWQLVVALHLKPAFALPAPGDVWASLVQQARAGHLSEAIFNSMRRAALGYGAALLIGTMVGLAVSRLLVLRTGVGSLLAALLSLPSVTWVPIGILWFGLTDATIYFVVILGAFPSI